MNKTCPIILLLVLSSGCDEGGCPEGNGDGEVDVAADPCQELVCDDPTPHCCQGECRRCCEDLHCDDANDCTVDSCTEGSCVNEPVVDRSDCAAGICCSGECRAGGECCGDEDCMEGCKGTERACNEFGSEGQCSSQRGCYWSGEGYCSGAGRCYGLTEHECALCNCLYSVFCNSYDVHCEDFTDEASCIACPRCYWRPPVCAGLHEPCADYPNADICNSQLDCYWSACVNYECT